MKELWNDTNDLNEALGDDFDVAAGWADFNKKKEKKRPIPFWFWGAWSMLGLILIIGLCYHQSKVVLNTSITTVDSQLSLETPPIVAHPVNIATNAPKRKASISNVKNGLINDKSSKVLKTPEDSARPIVRPATSIVVYKDETTPTPFMTKYTIQKLKKSTQNQSIKDNLLAATKAEQFKTKSLFSKQENSIDYLPILLSPLMIEGRVITPSKFPPFNLKTLPIVNKKWTFGLAYSYNRPKRTITGIAEDYQNLRQNGEQFLEQQQVALSIAHTFNQNFFLSTGLSYGRYRSKLVEKIQVLQSPVLYDNVVIETQTQNNITNEIKGTAIGSQLSINQSTRYQLYQTLTIPVQLGLQLPLNRNWEMALLSGVAFNVWQHARGNTYASTLPNGEFIPVNTLNYRSWGTIESISTLQIQRKITKRLNLNLGLQTKFDLTNRLQNNGAASDKWKSYGLSIGISKTW